VNRAAYLKPEDPKVEEIAEAIGFFKEGPLKLNLGRCGFSLWVGRGSRVSLLVCSGTQGWRAELEGEDFEEF